MASQKDQLTLEQARGAVALADAESLGAVAAYARLQLARAAAAAGEAPLALEAAVAAIPGLAVAAELGDAGQVLRWRGEPDRAWRGLSECNRAVGDRRAYLEAGVPALAAALRQTLALEEDASGNECLAGIEAVIAATDKMPWITASPRWLGVLSRVPVILRSLVGGPPLEETEAAPDGDPAVWSMFGRALDPARPLTSRYADALGSVVSLATGGATYRPLRVAVSKVLWHRWQQALHQRPFDFRQPALRRARMEELRDGVSRGELVATATMFQLLGDGVAVILPWELEAWLKTPFEGVQPPAEVEA